jgi:hypothetical protein
MTQSQKKEMFRQFASGMTPEQVLEAVREKTDGEDSCTDDEQVEQLLVEYLTLPIVRKLKLTTMPECVGNQTHRLIDDILDLGRIDALLDDADEKSAVALLDMKRKIKERMAKELPATPKDQQPVENEFDDQLNQEIEQCYRKLFGASPHQE